MKDEALDSDCTSAAPINVPRTEPRPRRDEKSFFSLADYDVIVIRHAGDDRAVVHAMFTQYVERFFQIDSLHLDNGAQLFSE